VCSLGSDHRQVLQLPLQSWWGGCPPQISPPHLVRGAPSEGAEIRTLNPRWPCSLFRCLLSGSLLTKALSPLAPLSVLFYSLSSSIPAVGVTPFPICIATSDSHLKSFSVGSGTFSCLASCLYYCSERTKMPLLFSVWLFLIDHLTPVSSAHSKSALEIMSYQILE
jgi:hypothetical protein